LRTTRPVPDALGVALVLAPERSVRSLATIAAGCAVGEPDVMNDPALETLRRSIPAARALPLLRALAGSGAGMKSRIVLDYLPDTQLALELST
jgi:hypothetical protein